ncbi:CPA1 family monovalent cation:H+ antiporter [Rhodoligotrophos appendicifer]|uniref:cation:proton antiporter n=1 Tax=Rhodoligotrophos appendicifer TaxID=987056 RepID=UPI001186D69C|nr:sodium:proton antiporter [Rhodoligotrophos appendicifer]
MLTLFQLSAALLTLTAIFAWLNERFLSLPANIGLLLMGLGSSLVLIAIEVLFPNTPVYNVLTNALQQIDFYEAVMHGMLAFLLFAGALHVDLGRLRSRAAAVGLLATGGVVISMFIVATGLWLAARGLNLPIGFAWCLVFGTLIAPTDPVAVLSTIRAVKVPESLETDISGESLFNDGVAVVLFTIALQAATAGGDDLGASTIARLLLLEAGGGAALGLVTGIVAYQAMRAIDDFSVEVMISLALVTATYAIADQLHMSGPISVVVAGVLIGNRGASHAMSDVTRRYVFGFWTLIDEMLNAVLFLLIGLEVLVLRFDPSFGWIALIVIPLVTAARFISVASAVTILSCWQRFVPGTISVLTWGGLRGGISVALALSLPDTEARPLILAGTYAVVLFTIIVQGLSLGRFVKRRGVSASTGNGG